MRGKPRTPNPGWERLAAFLLGACLALIVLGVLSRCQAPGAYSPEGSAPPRRGVGLDLELRFQILLPEREDG